MAVGQGRGGSGGGAGVVELGGSCWSGGGGVGVGCCYVILCWRWRSGLSKESLNVYPLEALNDRFRFSQVYPACLVKV